MSNKKTEIGTAPKLGSAAKAIVEKLKKNGGWGKFDRRAGFKNGKLILPGLRLSVHLRDIKELTHPRNPTPFMVEFVRIGHDDFLHLVAKPPRRIINALDAARRCSYEASNDIWPLIEYWMSQPVASSYKGKPIKNLIRHPKNPFRAGSSYGILVDLIAWASPGILKEPLLNMYCAVTRKSRKRATSDLSVIESAQQGEHRKKSCRAGFIITKENGFYSIQFV